MLEVVIHRTQRSGLTACEVVAKKRQFPWFKKKGLVELTPETLKHYNEAVLHGPVLKDEKFIYFNGVRPHGVGCRRIGRHIFCREKDVKATITQPGLMEFSQAHKGMLFRHEAGIYVKMSDDAACVIYKHSGHMNAGSTEKFGLETKVVRVAEATFTLG